MGDLLDRRKRDLEEQFDTLPRELDHWQRLTGQRSYEKHFSQVAALSAQMRALNDRVKATWNGETDFVAIRKAQRDCGAVHAVWNYFREKLVMRADAQLGGYLRAADAYVWACYAPVLAARRAAAQAAATGGAAANHTDGAPFREPPLVTFDVEQSAWALSRGREFMPHGLSGGTGRTAAFAEVLDAMPIAVIGTPWQSAALLPSLAALSHETGHVVDTDFAMGAALSSALDAALASSPLREGWSDHWRREVFADLFACYVAGPSFVWSLVDSVPESPEAIATLVRPSGDRWGTYPPAMLRVLMNLQALRTFGYDTEADRIEAYWRADYPAHAMGLHEADLPLVVRTVYESADLPSTLAFRQLHSQVARITKRAIRDDVDLIATEPFDPRAIVAVAVEAHRDAPAGVDRTPLWRRLQKHIVESRPAGKLAGQAEQGPAVASRMRTDTIAALLFADDASDVDESPAGT